MINTKIGHMNAHETFERYTAKYIEGLNCANITVVVSEYHLSYDEMKFMIRKFNESTSHYLGR